MARCRCVHTGLSVVTGVKNRRDKKVLVFLNMIVSNSRIVEACLSCFENPFYKGLEETFAILWDIRKRKEDQRITLKGKLLHRREVMLFPPYLAIVFSRHLEKFQPAIPGQGSAPVA